MDLGFGSMERTSRSESVDLAESYQHGLGRTACRYGLLAGTPNITTEAELAEQFKGFFRNFVDTFDLRNRSVYITGESYAGQYVPNIASSMLDEENKEYFNVTGIMLYDPSLNQDAITEQIPTVAFVDYWGGLFPFNDTIKAQIKDMDEKCGYTKYLNEHLTFPPKGKFPDPPATTDECDIFDFVYNTIFDINPCFDIYQVRNNLPHPLGRQWRPGSGDYSLRVHRSTSTERMLRRLSMHPSTPPGRNVPQAIRLQHQVRSRPGRSRRPLTARRLFFRESSIGSKGQSSDTECSTWSSS